MFGSGADWADLGYVDALKEDHQLILVDSRGHGESEKPHDPAAYSLAHHTSDVLAVLDDLSIQNADYFGYSLGGWIGFGLAKCAPQRFRSFIFGAAHPYAEDMKPFRDYMPRSAEAFEEMVDQGFGSRISSAVRSRILANDLEALRALTQNRESNADVLPSMAMPCFLFVGDLDPRLAKVRECASELRNATLFTLPECDHIGGLFNSEPMIPRVKTFLSRVPR
jgi:pimeloyl-ACP methyl ester carboxylesterase